MTKTIPTSAILAVALLLASLTACGGDKTVPDSTRAPTTANHLDVVVSPPKQRRANFLILRKGQDGYEKLPTRVSDGRREQVFPLGKDVRIAVPASFTELQRIRIDGHDYLLQIAPGSQVILTDNPCNGFELSAPGSDVNGAKSPEVVCAASSSECPEHYAPSPYPGLADDPLCADAERRCARMTEVTLRGELASVGGQTVSVGHIFERGPTVCDFTEVSAANDRVRLLPPIGARWTLMVTDGRISGRVEPPRPTKISLPVDKPPVVAGPADSAMSCVSNDDCTTTFAAESGCCGSCERRPVSNAWLKKKAAKCALMRVHCPPNACPPAQPMVAVCVDGQCVAEPTSDAQRKKTRPEN